MSKANKLPPPDFSLTLETVPETRNHSQSFENNCKRCIDKVRKLEVITYLSLFSHSNGNFVGVRDNLHPQIARNLGISKILSDMEVTLVKNMLGNGKIGKTPILPNLWIVEIRKKS